ncbi:MAG: aspartate carbamoyltransferase [Oscillospiraceae bacterium]|nr:aspartate carbamoyltransferase [Oscillospiraceae bacterium]
MSTRHLIDLDSISSDQLKDILDLAKVIMKHPQYFCDSGHGKIMATLFYEPSTRTQMSFQSAMLKLGGKLVGFDNPDSSSVSKGESLRDTVRVVSNYADLIVIRHPCEGAAQAASTFSRCNVINAGDGGHLHPTQTLTDLFTLINTKGTLSNLTIGICGDLKNGRTVHSLIKSLVRYKNNKFVFISTPQLNVPDYLKQIVINAGCEYSESISLSDSISKIDVLYMTRIQRERFESDEDYKNQKGVFVLDKEKMKKAKYGLKILHPLPRVDEIDYEVDDDSRAVYFDQTEYGMYARMALILYMLENSEKKLDARPESNSDKCCCNPRCITNHEHYLPNLYIKVDGRTVCEYCDHTQPICAE